MEVFAHVKFVRMSPRKVKLVCDMIRGKDVKTAAALLSQTSKAACEPMAKLLKSAVANAEHNNGMNADNLYVSTVIANPGPVLKRGRVKDLTCQSMVPELLVIKYCKAIVLLRTVIQKTIPTTS